jgi:sugar lactone lactonase YvrE
MATKSRMYYRRLARKGLLVLSWMFCVSGLALAQKELVTAGSIIPLQHDNQWCQIYNIAIAPSGDTVLMDVCANGGYGSIYQLKPGATTFQTITNVIDSAGTYWNEALAMDAKGTFYVTDRYSSSQHLYRVPYNPANGTWDFSASGDSFQPLLDSGFEGNGTIGATFLDSSKRDGSGLLFVSEQNANNIIIIPVNADGSVTKFPSGPDAGQPEFQYLIKGLKDKVQPMAVDVNGNLYFIENPYDQAANRVTGVFMVPASMYTSCMAASAAGSSDPTVPCVSGAEGSLSRIDSGNPEKFNGITLDAAGNVYVGDSTDSYGGTRNGLIMIPNISGSPIGVTPTSFNFDAAEVLAPVNVSSNPTIDPRGFIWLPTGTASNYTPGGSSAIPGTGNVVLYQLGAANLGNTPVGTPSAAGTVFYTFSGTVTPASFGFSQAGTSDYSAVATNPYPPAAGVTPAIPCTAGKQYIAYSTCEYWVGLNPAGNNAVGAINGQVAMLDASNNPIPGSIANLTGIGTGPAAALLIPSAQTPIASGLVSPQQVAGDSLGNSYVADAGQGKVLMFPAGTTTASAGTSIGTGLTAPTGVTVDGLGDVFIGDSGKVLKVPMVGGKLNTAGQTVIQTGLGMHLNLAVDGLGNVFVADTDNARVVRIYNPQMAMVIPGTATVGTGFSKPSAVAVDNSGNLFVTDGTSLIEVNFFGGQSTITTGLAAPLTGVAVDPSGAVDVAQGTGILRIPMETAGLNFNDAAAIDNTGITEPEGLAIDSLGNLYASVSSYKVQGFNSTGPTTTTVSTPTVLELANAFLDFGIVSTATTSNPFDINLYNIGTAPLAFTGDPTFGGTNGADYMVQQDGQTPCDTTGAMTVASGASCTLGVVVTASANGVSSGTMSIPTNAVNTPNASATLEAFAADNLCLTSTSITLTPATGISYPGATTIAVSTTANSSTCSPGNMPNGGNIVLTLQPLAAGSSTTTMTKVLNDGTQTFSLTGLNGGTYKLFVSYRGDSIFGGSSSSRTFTLTVALAKPTVTLSEPTGIMPVNGTYYVRQGAAASLAASVTSTVGSPTGSVQFLNGTAVADPAQNPVALDGSGNATFATSNLVAGTYNLTASYQGDANFAAASSPVITIVVIPPSALITANPASVTTKAGTPVTSTLTLTALEGYSPKTGAQLYCDNTTLPQYSECTFDVPTIDFFDYPGIPQISHVTITSNIPVNVGEIRGDRNSEIAYGSLLGVGLLGLAFRKRSKLHRNKLLLTCLMLMLGGGFAGLTGCTNSSYTKTPTAPHVTTPSGTYHLRMYTIDQDTFQTSSLPFTLTVTIQ